MRNFISHSKAVLFVAINFISASCYTNHTPVEPKQLAHKTSNYVRYTTTTGVCNYNYTSSIESRLIGSGWKKSFEDNFNVSPNSSLNTNWNVWVGGAFNNELQLYTASPNNLFVTQDPDNPANSLLNIKAIKEQVVGPKYRQDVDATPTSFDFTSARIESKVMYGPGRKASHIRFISRIKLPSGYGMWPAFWSYGDNWPTNGEIDVLEARGNDPYHYETNYFYGRLANQNLVQNEGGFITTTTSLTDCWHVYEVIWTKQSLTYLLDGQVIDVKSGSYVPNLYGKLQKITLNQGIGGDFFYKDGVRPRVDQIPLNEGEGLMQVDWVKVYIKR